MQLKEGMVCPACEAGKLREKNEDMEFEYKNNKKIIPNRTLYKCETCNESFLNEKDERELEKLLADVRRISDNLLTSSEIKGIRRKYNMTQVQFAKALRVGEKNFARYENGQATQSNAMDNLLRILNKYPYAIRAFYTDWNDGKKSTVYNLEAYLMPKKKRKSVSLGSNASCEMTSEVQPDASSF